MPRPRALARPAATGLLVAALLLPTLARAELAPPPPARPADVETPESVVRAMYQSVSCLPAPDWDRFRSLFFPGARLLNVFRRDESGGSLARAISIDDYVARASVTAERDKLVQRELAHRTLQYGDLVVLWSSYEARRNPAGQAPLILRGIHAFQLVRSEGRWWIADVSWENDLDAGPVPDEFLR